MLFLIIIQPGGVKFTKKMPLLEINFRKFHKQIVFDYLEFLFVHFVWWNIQNEHRFSEITSSRRLGKKHSFHWLNRREKLGSEATIRFLHFCCGKHKTQRKDILVPNLSYGVQGILTTMNVCAQCILNKLLLRILFLAGLGPELDHSHLLLDGQLG